VDGSGIGVISEIPLRSICREPIPDRLTVKTDTCGPPGFVVRAVPSARKVVLPWLVKILFNSAVAVTPPKVPSNFAFRVITSPGFPELLTNPSKITCISAVGDCQGAGEIIVWVQLPGL
jgi:hypothetical protein